ncbi:TonB-dependent receptor [Mucilaginibacter sp. Bleaf8]|uniref:TonB-dependent receptor n=1 Tax=Mucilaginibacter sp. Bleaf8 TaxID=2834430 RepID=UPI001BCACD87|nr:TonB-dependent receptor [Mucilaginibacter sp. Bleaf8]MBS7563887.1 TonB-dependent receptor [Mucilaginibacter sp. Bleaf8]
MKFIGMICLYLLCLGSAQAQKLTLSGNVRNVAQRPLQAVKVILQPGSRTLLTDSAGNFRFTGLSGGNYNVSASTDGYHTATATVYLPVTQPIVLILTPSRHHLHDVVITDQYAQLRKKEESLNVEVVNSDFIQRNLGGSLMATLSRLPGIKTIGIGSGQSKPLIRGLGFNRVVVVDKGVKHEGQQWGADHGLELDQFAAGEVEIIKGAASFIYGSDAIGGVINVKQAPIPAAHTMGGSVDLIGKTNNNLYGTSVNLYGRSKVWFFDARATYQNYGDYRVPTDKVSVYNYPVSLYKNHLRNTAGTETGLHFSTGYVSDRFRSVFYVSNVYSKSGFFANAHGLEPRQVDTRLHDSSSRDVQLPSQEVNHFKVINRSTYHVENHQLEMELGYQRNFRQEFSNYINHGYMPPNYPDSMRVRIPSTLEREFDKHVYSLNFRDVISLGKHTVTAGINGEYQDNDRSGWSFLVPAFNQTLAGAFVYDKFELNDRILLHGALRYDYGRINMFRYADWFPSYRDEDNTRTPEYLVRADNKTRTFNSLVWSVGMNYNLEDFTIKANVGKSFRMPIAKELGANGVNYHYFSYEKGNADLSPEQSYQADLSVGFAHNRWSVQVSPFYNYFSNYIYLNPTSAHDYFYGAGNQVFQYTQSRVARYGGEVDVKYQLLKSLTAEALGEYVYARQLSGDKKGFTLPFSPPASLLLNLTWSPQVIRGLNNTYLSVDYRLTSKQNRIVPPELVSPGYNIVNVQAGTRIRLYNQPVMVSLQAQNLFNTRYLNHTSFYRLINLPEAGRNIILSLKVPFQLVSSKN